MSTPLHEHRFHVAPVRDRDSIRIEDQSGKVVALVLNGNVADAHLMAGSQELYDRLLEVRHLRAKTHDGKRPQPLLPPEAIAAIDAALNYARQGSR